MESDTSQEPILHLVPLTDCRRARRAGPEPAKVLLRPFPPLQPGGGRRQCGGTR